MNNRDLFAREALAQIPKILTLLDRNPHSPTYGCFDRTFWQYKVIDFPAGMSQEFVYPLALAYYCDLSGNIYYQQLMIKEWVKAGIDYAYYSSHANGSCDDYFPFERAAGAAAAGGIWRLASDAFADEWGSGTELTRSDTSGRQVVASFATTVQL